MKHTFLTFVILFGASLLFPDDAEAKRRGGFIYIPGLSETIVKVKDLPDVPALQRSSGEYIDLGYKFGFLWTGEWVGHIGSGSSYLPLKPLQLSMILALGGMKEPPPVPSRPGGTFMLILVGIVVLVGIFKVLKNMAGGSARREPRQAPMAAAQPSAGAMPQMPQSAAPMPQVAPAAPMPQMPAQPAPQGGGHWTQGADQAIAAMAATRAASPASQQAMASAGFGQRAAPPAAAGAARPQFGRR